MPVDHRPPRDECKAEPIVEHRKATADEYERAPVDPGDPTVLWRRTIRQSHSCCDARTGLAQFLPSQRFEQIAGKDNALALPSDKSLLDEELLSRLARLRYRAGEGAGAEH